MALLLLFNRHQSQREAMLRHSFFSQLHFFYFSAVLVIHLVNDCFSSFIFTNSLLQNIHLSGGKRAEHVPLFPDNLLLLLDILFSCSLAVDTDPFKRAMFVKY